MFYKVNTTKLQIRNGPGTSYVDIGDLFMNDEIEVSETLGGWHHIVKISNATLPDPLKSWCSASYTVEIPAPNPEPDPDPTPAPTVKPLTVTIGGDDYISVTVTLEPKP